MRKTTALTLIVLAAGCDDEPKPGPPAATQSASATASAGPPSAPVSSAKAREQAALLKALKKLDEVFPEGHRERTEIEPAKIPSRPVAGAVGARVFEMKKVSLQARCNGTYFIKLFDNEPKGDLAKAPNYRFEVVFPLAKVPGETSLGFDDPAWIDGEKARVKLVTKVLGIRSVVTANAGESGFYIKIAEWKLNKKPKDGIVGTAKGKLSIRTRSASGSLGGWVAGEFDAVILPPVACPGGKKK